ncbi:hypothetical protein ACXC9Q_02000 [Kribbella sp. CWNU-51]
MAAKPNPALGLVLGIIAGYAAVVGASYAGARLQIARQVTFDSVVRHGLQWLVLLLLIATVLGLLMAGRTIGAGVMVGAGAVMALAGLFVQVAPINRVSDLLKLFQVPGSSIPPYLLMDSSMLFVGVVLLVAGIGRWAADGKATKLAGQPQDYRGQQPPQQWGGYPGQQQQPPYPGQQQQPQQYPGQPPR